MLSPDKSTGAASKPAKPLGERIKEYLAQNDLTVKQFADRAGSSPSTIYKIYDGKKVKSTQRIEAVLDGRNFSVSETDVNTFDATSEKLITMVSDLAAGQNELDELVRLVFNRWAKVKGADDSKAFAVSILRQYLATESAEGRLETLLELRDLMKENSKKGS